MNIIICVDNTEFFDKIKNEINKESRNIIVLDVDSQDEVRLENAIKKIHSLYEKNEEEVILIKSESGLHRVKQSEIYYFTIVKRKLNICLTDGRELRAWKTIKEFQEELNDSSSTGNSNSIYRRNTRSNPCRSLLGSTVRRPDRRSKQRNSQCKKRRLIP